MVGTAGDDELEAGFFDVVVAGDGDDVIVVGTGAVVCAGRGDDRIVMLSDGYVEGGPGNDTLDYSRYEGRSHLRIDLVTGQTTKGTAGSATFMSIENVIGPHNAEIIGDAGRNVIRGGRGRDSIDPGGGRDIVFAGAGVDVVHASDGHDRLHGGPGRDAITYAAAPGPVDVDLAARRGTGWGRDRVVSFEGIAGSPFDDRLAGDDGANWFFGSGGSDTILGRGGDDDAWAEDIYTEDGFDVFDGGSGFDRCVEFESASNCEGTIPPNEGGPG